MGNSNVRKLIKVAVRRSASMFSQKMSSIKDLCLVVIALLAIVGLSQAAPPLGRVVNGTDSSVEKYPFVVS